MSGGLAWRQEPLPLLDWAAAPAGVRVSFTCRHGGVSSGAFASLNMGALTADDAANVAENRRRAVAGAGGDGATATMAWQVHGTDIREVTDAPSSGRFLQPGAEPFPKSDGLVTSSRGRALTLLTADCLPVAIAAADGSRLALLHAGWRGIEAGVIEAGVAAVGGEAVAAIGPGAGPCCYEVGPEVHQAFGVPRNRRATIDLRAIARERLRAAGVQEIREVELCTICDGRFYSHRREGERAGRQAGIAWLS